MNPGSPASPGPAAASAAGYLAHVGDLLGRMAKDELPAIGAAAQRVAQTVAGGGTMHAFGTGHSHLLAAEMFYRAGGLANVNPILMEGLMLHAGASLSTRLERLPGLAGALLDDQPVAPGDVLVVASNSGGNAVCEEMARSARQRGLTVIAITSLAHATAGQARASHGRQRLHEIADIVLDNHGQPGDASIRIDGFDRPVAPTSTVLGAALVNALVAQTVEILVARGLVPEVFVSSNTEGGDEVNDELVRRYRGVIRAL